MSRRGRWRSKGAKERAAAAARAREQRAEKGAKLVEKAKTVGTEERNGVQFTVIQLPSVRRKK